MITRDLDSKTDAMRLAGEHKGPVLEFDWHNSLVASGDKNGLLIFWVLTLIITDYHLFFKGYQPG